MRQRRRILSVILVVAMLLSTVVVSPAFAATDGGEARTQAVTSSADLAGAPVLQSFTDPDTNLDAKPMSRHWYPDAGAGLTQAQIDEIKANPELADELVQDEEYLYQVADMITELYEGGFGGVEMTMLSDSAKYSQGMAEYIGWGTEAWVRVLAQALYTANGLENGFKVDITMTAHWPLTIDTIDPNSDAQQQQMNSYTQTLDPSTVPASGTLELDLPEQRYMDYFPGFSSGGTGDLSATFLFVDKWVGTTIAIQDSQGNLVFDSMESLEASSVAGYAAGVPGTDYIINVNGHWEEFSGTPTQAQLDSGEVVETVNTDTFGIKYLNASGEYEDSYGRTYMADTQYIYSVSAAEVQRYMNANPLGNGQSYVLVNSYRQGTGQVVSGGEVVNMANRNYVADYYSEAGAKAVTDYWNDYMLDLPVDVYDADGNTVSGVTLKSLLQDNEGALFEDSLEMHITEGTGWSEVIVDEFEDYLGYDLAPYLPIVSGYNVTGDNGQASKINSDFSALTDELFNKNHSSYISNWAQNVAGFKGGYRYQSSNSLSQSLNVDIVESDNGTLSSYRLLKSSSTINLRGDQYHSLEALTVTTTDPWYYDTMLELNMNFSRGINRVILHGTPFVQSATGRSNSWPGWAFNNGELSAYGVWNSRQPFWEDISIFSDYVTRVQGLLQNATTKIPVMIVGPTSFTSIDDFVELMDNGYHYNYTNEVIMLQDYAAPSNIEDGVLSPDGLGTEMVVLYGMSSVDDVAFIERMIEYAEAGVTVVLCDTDITAINGVGDEANNDAAARAAFATLKTTANVIEVSDIDGLLAAANTYTNNTVSYSEENIEVTHLVDHADDTETDYYFFYNYKGGSDIGWGGVGAWTTDGLGLTDISGEDVSLQVTLDGNDGGTPYLLDGYTGEITKIRDYTTNEDGTISLTLDIPAWDSAIVAVSTNDDAFSEAGAIGVTKTAGGEIDLTDDDWSLTIDAYGPATDQNAGAKFYETTVTRLELGEVGLGLWQDLDVAQSDLDRAGITQAKVSSARTNNNGGGKFTGDQQNGATYLTGIGYYTTTVTWDGDSDGTYLYYEHEINDRTDDDGINRDMVTEVKVTTESGRETVINSINPLTGVVDLGDALEEGDNEITIKLTTTLRNREWLEGYYINMFPLSSYGLTGVSLVPYDADLEYKFSASSNEGGSVRLTRDGNRGLLEIIPDEGYKLLSILINGVTVDPSAVEDGIYVIEDLQRDVVVRVLFIGADEDFAARYSDISPTHESGEDTWYYEAVDILTGLGILEGYEDGTLAPGEEIKRSEFTKLMYALAEILGEDVEIIDEVPFGDSQTSWAKGYIGWAYTNSLVTGYDDDTFGPDDDILRQDMALFMQRLFVDYLKYELPGSETKTFSDADDIEAYAAEAVEYAVRTGLMEGHANGEFAPQDGTQRSHVAQVLFNYLVY